LVTDMRGKVFIEGAGHWVQMERPAEVNEALLGFLKSVS
jgi:pimeloyl-ACP methyl ester carboxylesterase